MRNFKVIAVALVLVLGVACKKKNKTDGGGAGTAATGSGTAAGSDTMAGSGSDTMAGSGSDTTGAGSGSAAVPEPKKEIVIKLAADMKWEPLDPSAPDGPIQRVVLWGDPATEPNGWLIKVKANTPGMAHTHTNGYHGIPISGAPNHLQGGDKKPTPLPAGSYWFEPGGVPHNSQCLDKKVDCVALVHFNDGKFDFAPAELKKDGKRDPKYVEKVAKDIKFAALMPDMKDKGPMIVDIWGDSASGPHGRFWKFPGGFASPAHTHAVDYHAVVIKGTAMNYAPDDKAPTEMGPGSYWMQPAGMPHITACKAGAECLVYTYTVGKFDFTPAGDAAGGAGGGGSAAGGSAAGGSAAGGSAAGGSAAGGSGSAK
jgi:Domain of unknown function (DUF4437)